MSYLPACLVADLEDNVPRAVNVSGTPIAVVRVAGAYYAIQDRCSHAFVPLSAGEVEGCSIECPAHGAGFDLRTGRPLSLPATKPVAVYPVRVTGQIVEIDLDNPYQYQES